MYNRESSSKEGVVVLNTTSVVNNGFMSKGKYTIAYHSIVTSFGTCSLHEEPCNQTTAVSGTEGKNVDVLCIYVM